ncbi:MAG: hypothetical protein KAI61_02800 [Alphaproteobacteria bacterium]|nr:hypothetical protein [Alphaproteobacteria bacterium]MCK5659108.1 hypothetical protein [Alphaproteobacteria bacterium]
MDLEKIIDHKDYKKICAETGLPVETADVLIDSYLEGVSSVVNPVILHTLGIPGSGKTTYVHEHTVSNAVVISFDGSWINYRDIRMTKHHKEIKLLF